MKNLRQWLSEGDFTLSLSSSFFGFFSHCGITQALYEEGLLPSRLSGASAGALVGAALSSGLKPEDLGEILFRLRREDFWDPRPGLGYLRGRKMREHLESHLAPSFSQAKIPITVVALDMLTLRTRFLTEGSLPLAVAASCAVPFLFHPVRIGGRFYLDGGVFHKSGVAPEVFPGERNLCVYLEGEGVTSAFEGKTLPRERPDQKVWRFKRLPAVSYHSLDRGPEAFTAAYRRAKEALDKPFAGPVSEG